MPIALVDCPHCEVELEIEQAAEEMVVECPECGEQMMIEAAPPPRRKPKMKAPRRRPVGGRPGAGAGAPAMQRQPRPGMPREVAPDEIPTEVRSKISQGRVIAIILISILIGVSILSLMGTYSQVSAGTATTTKAAMATVRTLLTCLICLAMFSGQHWARILMGILTGLGTVAIFAASAFVAGAVPEMLWFMILIGIAYLGVSVTLFVSKSLKVYQDYKCGRIYNHC